MNHANNEVHDTPEQTNSKFRVRKDSWGPPPKQINFENFRECFFQKMQIFTYLIGYPQKILSVYCALIIDATDHPHSLFQALYHKLFRGAPRGDQMPPVWPTGPPRVRKHQFLAAKKGHFWG